MDKQRTGSRFRQLAWRLLEYAQREAARKEREVREVEKVTEQAVQPRALR